MVLERSIFQHDLRPGHLDDAVETRVLAPVAGISLLSALAAVPLSAHHAFAAEFEANRPAKFEATVKRMLWSRPDLCGRKEIGWDGRGEGRRRVLRTSRLFWANLLGGPKKAPPYVLFGPALHAIYWIVNHQVSRGVNTEYTLLPSE
jgi:hypothetical protein